MSCRIKTSHGSGSQVHVRVVTVEERKIQHGLKSMTQNEKGKVMCKYCDVTNIIPLYLRG